MPSENKSTYNRWVNSGQIGPRPVISGFAVLIGFFINRRERLSRLSHPYNLLSRGPQPASETITAGTRATEFTAFWKGLYNGNISLALLSLVAILSDFMLIIIPGVPFSSAQTNPSFLASTYTCLGILVTIFLVQLRITYVESRKRNDQCPDTIAVVLTRLCASRFVEEEKRAGGME